MTFEIVFVTFMFFALGWMWHMMSNRPPGWGAFLLAAWAIPFSIMLHAVTTVLGDRTWWTFMNDMTEIPEILMEELYG